MAKLPVTPLHLRSYKNIKPDRVTLAINIGRRSAEILVTLSDDGRYGLAIENLLHAERARMEERTRLRVDPAIGTEVTVAHGT